MQLWTKVHGLRAADAILTAQMWRRTRLNVLRGSVSYGASVAGHHTRVSMGTAGLAAAVVVT